MRLIGVREGRKVVKLRDEVEARWLGRSSAAGQGTYLDTYGSVAGQGTVMRPVMLYITTINPVVFRGTHSARLRQPSILLSCLAVWFEAKTCGFHSFRMVSAHHARKLVSGARFVFEPPMFFAVRFRRWECFFSCQLDWNL